MEIYQLRQGMLVTFQGETVRVEKVKQKRLIVMKEDGRRWDVWPQNLKPAPEGATFDLKVEAATGLTLGSAVRFVASNRNAVTNPGVFVITGVRAGDEYQMARFGGDGGRYFRSVPATALEVLSTADVKAALAYLG